MHEFGVGIIWLSLQVTIVAIATAILYRLTLSRGPILRSLVVSSSMLVMLVLAGFAFSPWPRWSREVVIVTQAETVTARPEIAETIEKNNSPTAELPQVVATSGELESVWAAAWQGFQKGLEKPQPVTNTQVNQPLTWPAILGWLFVVGVSLGMLRLCLGFFLLWRETRLSSSLKQTAAQELLDDLLVVQPCRVTIRLRESQRLSTAAVVGCWRPVILLPATWKTWSTDQLRAVLTHELAHINQGDFLSNFCAEISRSVHFYHPLMHWLAARLRLEQELAADAAAAKLSGGAEPYLIILAELAMAQSHRPTHWPARAFLPTHSTFLRRIEVLKNKTPFTKSITRTTRAVTLAAVMLAGLTAIGFRSESNTIAEDTKPFAAPVSMKLEKNESTREKFRIDFVPDNAIAVVAIRPADILAQHLVKPIRKLLDQDNSYKEILNQLGMTLADIEVAKIYYLSSSSEFLDVTTGLSAAFVVQANKKFDRNKLKKIADENSGVEISSHTHNKMAYIKSLPQGDPLESYVIFPDDYTIIVTLGEQSMKHTIDLIQNGGPNKWEKQFKSIKNKPLGAICDVRAIRNLDWKKILGAGDSDAGVQVWEPILPFFENTDMILLSATLNKKVSIQTTFRQKKNGKKVKKGLDDLITQWTDTAQDSGNGVNSQGHLVIENLAMYLLDELLKSLEVSQNGENVWLTATLPDNVINLIVAPMLSSSIRDTARRQQSNE